jgi:hypothetical protein
MDFSGGFTASLWANPSAVKSYGRFFSFNNGNNNGAIQLERNSTGNDLLFEVMNSGGTTIVSQNVTNGITNNTLQHFTVTVDASNRLRIYKNGVDVSSTTMSSAIPTMSRSNRYIGRSGWAGDPYYIGTMDEIRFSRVARSSDWVRAEYLTQNGSFTNFAAEEGRSWITFDNASVTHGTQLTATSLPSSTVPVNYSENATSAVSATTVPVGGTGEWDFTVQPPSQLPAVTTSYYFRLANEFGAALSSYSSYAGISLML